MKSRKIETTVDNILSLIACADDYGLARDVLFDAFRGMLDDKLSDEEIEEYVQSVKIEEDYGEEDCENIKERLLDFKKKFIE